MRPVLAFAALALLALSAPAIGAQNRPGTAAQGPNFSGLYRTVQVNRAGKCAPRPLPAPAPRVASDTNAYFPAAAALAADTIVFWARFTQTGTKLTMVIADSLGRDTDPPITGTVRPDGRFTLRRMLRLGLEGGPRQGGRRFFLEQEASGPGKFEPPGGGARWSGSVVFTHRFHADSATGTVFTTCTRPSTVNGTRVSP